MSNKKLNKRQIQAQNTRDKIYNTAVEMMEKKGLNNITVEEICQKSGVSVGSFYNCFKSKNDILNEVYKLADDYFLNTVSPDLAKINGSYDKVIQFFKYYAEYNVNRGFDFVKQLYFVPNTLFITKGRPMQTVLKNIVEEGQRLREIGSSMPSEEIVEYFFIAARGVVYDWVLHGGSYNLSNFMESYIKRMVKTLD
ncbi:TetR/AcrR family transcriptional regulator [Oxobacter pfennigii]|nr:TetR/AcrR family transcriptional regulator [Oxobacter pfennigii]